MKTICVIHFTAAFGGGTKSFFDVINMLKADYRVIACVPSTAYELIEEVKKDNVEVALVPFKIPILPYYSGSTPLVSPGMFKSLSSMRYRRRFAQFIMNLKPDVVIYNSIVSIISAGYLELSVKKICIVRETLRETILSRIFLRRLEKSFSGVAFLSEYERVKAQLCSPKTTVIPDCLAPSIIKCISKHEAREVEKISDKSFVVLFLGGMSPLKGSQVILKALDRLDHRFVLLLGGVFREEKLTIQYILKRWYSPRYVYYMSIIRKYYNKCRDRVRLTGYRSDISSIMCASDVLVFPSTAAHQPRPGIEAGEYSIPVVISDYNATKEYFINGVNALTFKPNSPKDLARQIEKLSTDENLKEMLGDRNNTMTKELHDYERTSEKLRRFINECVENDMRG